jgi:signal recognition particle subunit SRP54
VNTCPNSVSAKMVLADLGRKLNAALSSLNRASVVDEKVCMLAFIATFIYLTRHRKVLDATLKEITAALLETDVNVKLVASLRQKVKSKVKDALESNASEKSKELNKKTLIQKVSHGPMHPFPTRE